MLAAGRGPASRSREALATLCESYWYPVYAFVRRLGHSAADAEDLTQAFFARLLEKDFVGAADPERGRFRSFLLASVKHFLANERDRETALKRGGGAAVVSLDDAERRYRREPSHGLTPERAFERRWALTLLERTLAALREEQERAGHAERFTRLKCFLTGEGGAPSHAEVAAELGMTEGAVKVAVHRLRRRYRELLRAEIAETIADPSAVDDELRELFVALGG